MRILAVADIHGRLENISRIAANIVRFQADLLVVAGDLTRYRGSKKSCIPDEPVFSTMSLYPWEYRLAERGKMDERFRRRS